MNIKAFIQLMRPANLVTAVADVWAGAAIAGAIPPAFDWRSFLTLSAATVGLYGGGVVFNDVFDAQLDAVERPERPIPSGQISIEAAIFQGTVLHLLGIGAASLCSLESGIIAAAIAILTLSYDRFAKHDAILGPLNMGLCRGLNLLLGVSLIPELLSDYYAVGFLPIIFIAAITMISRGEVHGGHSRTMLFAGVLYAVVEIAQLAFGYMQGHLLEALPLVLIHAFMVFKPLLTAYQNPIGPNIGKAVKAGVLSLIIMNAAWCMAFGAWPLGLATLLLLPFSLQLAKWFAVT
ncbi:UbiA-like protein EboC [Siphonobacter sp. SORGH_AS_0500]|uniref:UbiA-like protein EboC n=1 Tax=Siphonobacter sp. SORGH_AS_0500 TaxID=1864824 RepID=UPI003510CA36